MSSFTESIVEEGALAWLESLGWRVTHGLDIAPGFLGAERSEPNYRDVVLEGRLCQAPVCLNPDLPPAALRDTLLPKLISGKRRVKDAERIVEIA